MKLNRLVKWLEHLMNISSVLEGKLTKCYLKLGVYPWPFRLERENRRRGGWGGRVGLSRCHCRQGTDINKKRQGTKNQQVLSYPRWNSPQGSARWWLRAEALELGLIFLFYHLDQSLACCLPHFSHLWSGDNGKCWESCEVTPEQHLEIRPDLSGLLLSLNF